MRARAFLVLFKISKPFIKHNVIKVVEIIDITDNRKLIIFTLYFPLSDFPQCQPDSLIINQWISLASSYRETTNIKIDISDAENTLR